MIFDRTILGTGGYFYLGTDWHLGHKNIIGYDNRPCDYEDKILNNIKETITENDVYINLGDVIFSQYGRLRTIIPNLPGKYILVMGNHDKEKPQWYINSGFKMASRILILEDIVFSHRPVNISIYPGCCANIHGHFHTHNRKEENRKGDDYEFYKRDKNFCIYIDDHTYQPIKLKEFLKENNIKSRLLKDYD